LINSSIHTYLISGRFSGIYQSQFLVVFLNVVSDILTAEVSLDGSVFQIAVSKKRAAAEELL